MSTPAQANKPAHHRERLWRIVLAPVSVTLFVSLLIVAPLRALATQLLLSVVPRRAPSDPSNPHFDVICFSHVAWKHIWQRNHHTMTRLAKKREVVYFETTGATYIHVLAKLFPKSLKTLFGHHPKVRVKQPFLLPGESRLRLVRDLNRWICLTHMRWYEWRYKMQNTVIWFYYPGMVYVLQKYKPAAVVYDIQDEYSAFSWAPRDIAHREQQLLEQTDVIFAGTHALYEKKTKDFSRPAYFFPCAVEFEHFNAAAPSNPAPPAEPEALKGLPRPRLFYMGLIDARIDAKLIAYLSAAQPDWQIIMAGPVDTGQFAAFSFGPNVHFLGKVDYQKLPALMAHCDVYLMPWEMNDLTRHINPTKTLEYLAAARPVVSIKLPDLEAFFGEYVALAETPEEFLAMCRQALDHPDPQKAARGVELARAYSWENVVEQMEEHVQQARQQRG